MHYFRKLTAALLTLTMLTGCRKVPLPESSAEPAVSETEAAEAPERTKTPEITEEPQQEAVIDEDGIYDTKDEVALYLYTYHHLPSNYMTKKEARKLGWSGGALNRTVKNMCIGGDIYRNYEGALPDIRGNYYECDIDTINRSGRGGKRIVWSDDYDIYYTEDHYNTFEQWIEGEWQ